MISFICGQVADTTENSVIIETGGIGYEVFMTGTAIEQAVRMEGKVKVHTYFHVREDAMQLYGFWNKDDLQMFRLLLGVNGIGPKVHWEFWQDLLLMSFGSRYSLMMSRLFPSAWDR